MPLYIGFERFSQPKGSDWPPELAKIVNFQVK
jgi:hypothetical protein